MDESSFRWRLALLPLLLFVGCGPGLAQQVTVTGRVAWSGVRRGRWYDASQVVVWLTPVGTSGESKQPPGPPPKLVQKNKSFSPHLLIVPVGSTVEFPNRDPFFHNVFSLFEGKRFDLGLYEAGSSRFVHFDKPGVSYIFCNIHAEMSAVVIALPTPYYGVSSQQGEIVIPNVPVGRYTLRVWYEAAPTAQLESETREVSVVENASTLGVLRLSPATMPTAHPDKYGKEYEPPSPDNPAYTRP